MQPPQDCNKSTATAYTVPDEVLLQLAQHGPERDRGELSPEDMAILVPNLADICREAIIARRLARRSIEPFPNPRNHCEEIANARNAVGL